VGVSWGSWRLIWEDGLSVLVSQAEGEGQFRLTGHHAETTGSCQRKPASQSEARQANTRADHQQKAVPSAPGRTSQRPVGETSYDAVRAPGLQRGQRISFARHRATGAAQKAHARRGTCARAMGGAAVPARAGTRRHPLQSRKSPWSSAQSPYCLPTNDYIRRGEPLLVRPNQPALGVASFSLRKTSGELGEQLGCARPRLARPLAHKLLCSSWKKVRAALFTGSLALLRGCSEPLARYSSSEGGRTCVGACAAALQPCSLALMVETLRVRDDAGAHAPSMRPLELYLPLICVSVLLNDSSGGPSVESCVMWLL